MDASRTHTQRNTAYTLYTPLKRPKHVFCRGVVADIEFEIVVCSSAFVYILVIADVSVSTLNTKTECRKNSFPKEERVRLKDNFVWSGNFEFNFILMIYN